jgi:hypothetical protein
MALGLAACNDTYGFPQGPFASPPVNAPEAVAQRGCGATSTPSPPDLRFMQTSTIRQGTDLQRVADDLDGRVPGGNLQVDTALAAHDAQALEDLIATSGLCPAVRGPLAARAAALAQADLELEVAGRAGQDAAAALARARAAYQQLAASVSPSPSP